MEIDKLDQILEKLRIIESLAQTMMLGLGNSTEDTTKSAYATCLEIIRIEAGNVRKLIRE